MHYIDADYISSMDVRFVQMSHFCRQYTDTGWLGEYIHVYSSLKPPLLM